MVAIDTRRLREVRYTSSDIIATTGANTHVNANIGVFITPNDLIDTYLEFTPVGVKTRPGVALSSIPHEAFDASWERVSVKLDSDRWQIADLSIMHKQRFDEGDCVRAMARVGLYRSISTAATWASWASRVPIEIRIPAQLDDGTNTKMSIYWHAHVAMLPLGAQQELLQLCLVNNLSGNERWTEDKFGEVCQAWREEHNYKPPQERQRPANRPARDAIFEATMELGAVEAQVSALKSETSQLAASVTDTETRLRALAWDVRKILVVV